MVRLILVASAISLAVEPAHAQQFNVQLQSSIESTVDTAIDPGDDFFAYANGRWSLATPIPNGHDRWGAREEIAAVARERVARILHEMGPSAVGTPARMVADFRAAYADDAAIEARGLAPLRQALDSIDRVQDRVSLARLLGSQMRADVDPLNWGVYRSSGVLGLAVEHSIHGEAHYTPFLVQGGLGLDERARYLDASATARALRERYLSYVAHHLSAAGFRDADRRAAAVVALETDLARTHATAEASALDRNADSVWTRADFLRRAPGFDWTSFFDAARLGDQPTLVVWQPSAVVGLAATASSAPLETWKDYLRFHSIDVRADVLPRAFSDAALALRGVTSTRAERADAVTTNVLSDAVDRVYVERWFPAAQKRRVQNVVAQVRAAFTERLAHAVWLTPASRAQALAKLATLYIGIGYPDRWPPDDGFDVRRDDAAGNLERASERSYRQALRRLHQPFDTIAWLMPAHSPGALLVFQQNSYVFSAALLQPPKFDPLASDAATFGAIGAIIGHDITHYIDALGAEYDASGRMRRWWTSEDSTRFEAMTSPLVDQFSRYRPFTDASVNGRLTRTENVADLAGLAAAFDAHRRALRSIAADSQRVRALDREFFIAFAQSWRSKETDAALRARIATNDHAPDRYRVATVRNIDAWYDAFDVRPGQAQYLPPAQRVRLW